MTATRSLRPFCSVHGAALFAVLDALGVEHTAQDVIAHARQVFDAAAADEHHRVLLQIVAFTRDVAHHFVAIGEANFRDLPQRRVRLLWRRRVDPRADAALLRTIRQGRHFVALRLLAPRLADQLIDCRHFLAFRSGPQPSFNNKTFDGPTLSSWPATRGGPGRETCPRIALDPCSYTGFRQRFETLARRPAAKVGLYIDPSPIASIGKPQDF